MGSPAATKVRKGGTAAERSVKDELLSNKLTNRAKGLKHHHPILSLSLSLISDY